MKKATVAAVTAIIAALIFALALLPGCSTYGWVRDVIDDYYYWDLPDDVEYDGDLKKFVATYLDRYSAYYTEEEYDAVLLSNSGGKAGVGISYIFVAGNEHPSGRRGVVVERVLGNSPAYISGITTGEIIVSGEYKGQSINFEKSDDFKNFLSSKPLGEKFSLVTAEGVSYTLSNEEYTASYCKMATRDTLYDITYAGGGAMRVNTRTGGYACLPAGAAYLRLEQFYGNATEEFSALIKKFNAEGCTSLILDLRGNGGGYVDVMSGISGIFLGELKNALPYSMVAEYKNGDRENTEVKYLFDPAEGGTVHAGTKISVLVDNGTASASEALVGVLIDNGLINYSDIYISDFGELYLNKTGYADKNCCSYGKGIMQSTFRHKWSGSALKLTVAKIYWPKGETSIHDVGLNASMGCKTVPTDWDVTYGDVQLSAAVNLIYG